MSVLIIIQIGAIYLWSYVYNIIRVSCSEVSELDSGSSNDMKSDMENHKIVQQCYEPLLSPREVLMLIIHFHLFFHIFI